MKKFKAFLKRKHKKHKHKLAMLIGIGIMLAGSTLATAHFPWLEVVPVFLVDGFAYFMHGIGAVPFVHGIEPLWALLAAE